MTEVQGTTDRKVKWLRYSARALAVAWAGSGSLIVILGNHRSVTSLLQLYAMPWLIPAAFLVLAPWVSTAIAWRWERVGGVLLAIEGFMVFIIGIVPSVIVFGFAIIGTLTGLLDLTAEGSGVFIIFVLGAVGAGIAGTSMALPPWILAILFVTSWRKPRTPTPPQDLE